MKKIINRITLLLALAFMAACVDESLDPVKFIEVKKATILALRGDAFNALNASGCAAAFFKNNIIGTEVYSIDADFLAEDQESLQEVQLYGQLRPAAPTAGPRVLVATIPGSAFTFPADSKVKRGIVSTPLSTIMSKLGLTTATAAGLSTNDVAMSMDLVLTDGSMVLASALNNPNLFQSVIFYPAMALPYCALDQENFRPIATPRMLGEYSKNATTGVVTRTVVPLKSSVKDTLHISYDQDEIKTTPSVAFTPANHGGTGTGPLGAFEVKPYKTEKNGFYVIYTAGPTFTGAVTATITGAVANVAGVDLAQASKTQTINVDNTAPVVISRVTGTRIGKGQFVTITATFNEPLSTKSANAIKVTVDGTAQGLEKVTDASMTIASNGLSASLIYIFKLAVPTVPATHGNMVVDFTTTAKDVAGNAVDIPDAPLTVDVNAPPAPTLTAASGYDLGTQIRWSVNTTSDPTPVTGNPGGAVSGNVYFIAINSGDLAPTGFSVDLDGVATWTMPVDATPPAGAAAGTKVAIRQTGTIPIVATGSSTGQSGTTTNSTVFTSFTANGTTTDPNFDVYAVFVSSSGTISAIPAKPVTPTAAPATANPLTITMQ